MSLPLVHGQRLIIPIAAIVTLLAVWIILRDLTILLALLTIVAVVIVTVAQVLALRVRSGVGFPAPAIVVVGLNLVGVTGYLFYRQLAPEAQVSAQLPDTSVVYNWSAEIFALASVSLWVGAMIVGRHRQEDQTLSMDVRGIAQSMSPRLVLLMGVVPILLLVIGYTLNALMQRDQYLDSYGPLTAVSAGSLFAPVGLAVLAFAVNDNRRPFGNRILAAAIIPVYICLLFAMGTRQLSLVPVLLYVGWMMNSGPQGRSRPAVWSLALSAGLAALILIQLPLSLRGGHSAGWVPFSDQVLADPWMLFRVRPGAIFGNILFGFPLAGTIFQIAGGTLPLHTFVTSINPLPGQFTDWSQVQGGLGLNQSTPYNGLGELAAYGWIYLIVFPAVIGAVLTGCQRALRKLPATAATILYLASLGSTAVYTLDLLQYNLRSGLRPVWYFLTLTIALRVLNGNSISPVINALESGFGVHDRSPVPGAPALASLHDGAFDRVPGSSGDQDG